VDTWLSHGRPRLELGRGVIAEGRVTAPSNKEHLNGREDVRSRVFRGRIVPVVHKLALECSEEAFVIVIVPAVAISAYAGSDAALVEQALIARGRILTAAIRVVWESCRWVAVRQRHDEGTLDQIHGRMVAHRPANREARVQIEHDGKVGQT
jgi:hypothetical protein